MSSDDTGENPSSRGPADWHIHLEKLRQNFEAASLRLPNLNIELGEWAAGTDARQEIQNRIEESFASDELLYGKQRPNWLFRIRLECWKYSEEPFVLSGCAGGHIGWWHEFQS